MKMRNVSKYLAVALLAGVWGCSPSATQRSFVYDDLYSSSSDVRAMAYSNKQNDVVEDQTKGENLAGNEYYNQTLADKYNNRHYAGNSAYDNLYGYNNFNNNYAYNSGFGNWNPYGWNSWNSYSMFGSPYYGGLYNGFGGFGPGLSIGLGIGSSFYRPWSMWGMGGGYWGGMGMYDSWYGSNWAYNPYGFGYGGWGNPYGGWGYGGLGYPYYGGYYGGGAVVTKPIDNGNSSYTRPRAANYGRSQSAYNGDFNRNAATVGTNNARGGRSAYNNSAAGGTNNSYYSRPRRETPAYSDAYNSNSNSYRSGNGTVNRQNNTYSRGWNSENNTRSNNWNNNSNSNSNSWNNSAPSRSYSAPAPSMNSGGGGGGARSRGPR